MFPGFAMRRTFWGGTAILGVPNDPRRTDGPNLSGVRENLGAKQEGNRAQRGLVASLSWLLAEKTSE